MVKAGLSVPLLLALRINQEDGSSLGAWNCRVEITVPPQQVSVPSLPLSFWPCRK